MCGIIGIIGKAQVAPLLLDGLRRLEYRGYDSAGVATLVDGKIERRRAEGKLANLATVLECAPVTGTIGIGHTRWATHGRPTEANAHPHANDRVALVHNGIIENFQELRDELVAAGHAFETETDSEVVVHLITQYLNQQMTPQEAVAESLVRLQGAFALAIVFAGRHDLMIGARCGSPLAVGFGDGEMYLGSDALALAPLTNRICYLEEGDWVELTRDSAQVHDATGARVERPVKQTALSGALIGKGQYRHFMQKEIFEQPAVVGDTLQSLVNPLRRSIALPALPLDLGKVPRFTVLACGTAHYAGVVAKYWFEQVARQPVEVDIASEFRYREAPLPEGGVTLCISQSGETIDTLAALRYARSQGQTVVSVVNVAESAIARESDAIDQGLHHAAHRARLPGDRHRAGARRHRCRGRGPPVQRPAGSPGAPGRGAQSRRGPARHRALLGGGPRRAVSRPRQSVPDRPGRRAQAQRDQLHPRRGLCRRRDEARTHRVDRRDRAGDRLRALGAAFRKERFEYRRGGGARRRGHPDFRRRGHREGRQERALFGRGAGRRPLRRAAALQPAGATARLSHRGP